MRGLRSPHLLAEEEGEEELLRQIDDLSTRLVRNRSAASFASSSPAASPSAHHTSPPPLLQGTTAAAPGGRPHRRPLETLPVPLRQRSPSSEYGQGRGGGGGAGGRVYHSKAAAGFDRVSGLGASAFAAGASVAGPVPARVSTVNDSSLLRHPVRLKRTPQTAPPLSRLPVTAPPPPDPLRPSGTAGARGRSWGPQPLADAPRPSRSPSPVLNSAMRTLSQAGHPQRRASSSPASRSSSPAGASPQRGVPQRQQRQQRGADGIVVLHDRVRMSDLVAASPGAAPPPAAAAVSSPLPSTLDASAFPERVSPAVADRDEYLRQLMGQSKQIKENLDRFCSTSTRRMESSHRDGAGGGGGGDHPHHPRRPLRAQHRYDDSALSSSPQPPATPPPQQPQQPEGEDLRAFLSRKAAAAAPLSPPPPQPADAPPPSAAAHRFHTHTSAPLPPQHTAPQHAQHAPQGIPVGARSPPPPPQETSLDVSNSPAPPSAPSPDRGHSNPSPGDGGGGVGGAMHRRGQRDASYDSVPDTTIPSCQIDLSVTPEAVTPERTQGWATRGGGGGGGGPPASAVEELLAERARLLEEQMERDRKLEMVEASLRNLTAQQISSIASATTTGLP